MKTYKMANKTCTKCEIQKPISEFHKNKAKKSGLCCWCRQCKYESYKNWLRTHKKQRKDQSARYYKTKGRANSTRRLYGNDIDYDRMYAEQNGCCAICNTHQSKLARRLHVDHNHETKIVRSLLCHNCNIGLGHFRHSKDLLNDAINYLKQYEDV